MHDRHHIVVPYKWDGERNSQCPLGFFAVIVAEPSGPNRNDNACTVVVVCRSDGGSSDGAHFYFKTTAFVAAGIGPLRDQSGTAGLWGQLYVVRCVLRETQVIHQVGILWQAFVLILQIRVENWLVQDIPMFFHFGLLEKRFLATFLTILSAVTLKAQSWNVPTAMLVTTLSLASHFLTDISNEVKKA